MKRELAPTGYLLARKKKWVNYAISNQRQFFLPQNFLVNILVLIVFVNKFLSITFNQPV